MPTSACRRYSSPKVWTRAVESVKHTPEQRSGDDQRLARKAIPQPAGQRSCQHVGDEKRKRQTADAFIIYVKCPLDQRLRASQHVTVRIVQQVQCCQQGKCRPRSRGWKSSRRVGCLHRHEPPAYQGESRFFVSGFEGKIIYLTARAQIGPRTARNRTYAAANGPSFGSRPTPNAAMTMENSPRATNTAPALNRSRLPIPARLAAR